MAKFKEDVTRLDILKVLNFYLKYNKYDKTVEALRDLILTEDRGGLVLNDYEAALISKALRFCQTREEFRLSKEASGRLGLELAVEPSFYYSVFGIEKETKPCRSITYSNRSLVGVSMSRLLEETESYKGTDRSIN